MWENIRERGSRNRLAVQGCRDREVPGEQVGDGKTESTRTGGGGRQERTIVHVDRQSKTGREGG